MRASRGVRVAFAVRVLLIFGFYLYVHTADSPFSEDAGVYHLRHEAEEAPPAEPELPIETPEPTPTPTPTPTIDPNSPEGKAAALGLPKPPDIDINSWEFLMANPDHNIGEYEPPLKEYFPREYSEYMSSYDDLFFDERIFDPITEFSLGAVEAGHQVFLSSGYRSYNTQVGLFNRKINQGYSEEKAATIVARPGTSEHQTGLACDITDKPYDLKNSDLENTELYKWMYAHCQEYGFILRFPKDKEDVTKIMYEPWHFRYVGVEAATYIMENGLCYEEFYDLYSSQLNTAEPAPAEQGTGE